MEQCNIKQFLDDSGKIIQLSEHSKKRRALLVYLAEKFEPDCSYSEREVNEICSKWHTLWGLFFIETGTG